MGPGFHREQHRCSLHWVCAQWSDFGAQGGVIQGTLCGTVGDFLCQSTPVCRFCLLPNWNSLSSQYELFYRGLLWFTLNSCSVSSIFEQVWALFEQTKRWMTVLMLDWRKSKCSGMENSQLWQCCRQNGSLIPYRKSCVYDCICPL